MKEFSHNMVPLRPREEGDFFDSEGDRDFFDEGDDYASYYQNLINRNNYSQYKYVQPDKTGHDFLRDMCKVRDIYSSGVSDLNPLTNRALFIISTLNELNVPYKLDIFNRHNSYNFSYNEPKLCNIIVEFKSTSEEPAILFDSHYDVVNINSDNAQDNTASVCNLLHLCKILSKETPNRRTIIVFSSGEECGMLGASHLTTQIKQKEYGEIGISYILELTGLGQACWVDTKNYNAKQDCRAVKRIEEVFGKKKFHHVSTPPSNVGQFRSKGLDAVCIGILPKEDIVAHKLWGICHSNSDSFEKTSRKDMQDFTDVLFQIVQHKSKSEPQPKTIPELSGENTSEA